MFPIETQDRLFHDGDGISELGTVLPASWLNQIQAELIAVLTAAGINPDKTKQDQVINAINKIISDNVPPASSDTAGIIKVINNLTSDNATAALSARQGMILFEDKLNKNDAATSAVKLQVPRLINGVKFDGSSDINVTPPGAVQFFAMNWVPTGWLKANGAEVSRTTYANLFAAIGFTYGEGDGKTTFNLPDLRSEFLRGWDDGRGVDDAGRIFGDTQADAIRNITGRSEVLHVQTLGLFHRQLGALKTVEQCQDGAAVNMGTTNSMSYIEFDASKCGIPVADENRPRNVALLACIKI